MAVYVGKSGLKKKAVSLYIWKNGYKKEIKNAYTSKNGSVKIVFAKKGMQVFTSSGIFTVPKGVKSVDVFLVGGGGSGGFAAVDTIYQYYRVFEGGNGGCGGYTTTAKGISVTPGSSYNIIIGAGSSYNSAHGGVSSGLGYEAKGGGSYPYLTITGGGSGGGFGTFVYKDWNYDESKNHSYLYAGNGGSDGRDGYEYSNNSSTEGKGCYGQHTTTKAFGESSGTLYAGGGGGGTHSYLSSEGEYHYGYGGAGGGGNGGYSDYYTPVNGVDNSGGGGGGGYNGYYDNDGTSTILYGEYGDSHVVWKDGGSYGKGGSGIVIIRWGY